ncbi:alpha/beta fold hydrolase [Paractinoplanes lichenicola]|uniref:Alpha/beta fold hydrolase n=1 Tax=Paractinoplanes lichenicola TaxID=2802976 RepID=A0ABS1W579_9ACTN|nr:alpha/beta fold hydrolase [Actinoplanes lichenicola]MBL7261900.1 alpha/beta fold hydrolase [Actinoplanes lichenicola]
MRPIHVNEWDGPASAAPAVLVHGTFSWALRAFEFQRALARSRRILLPDRRGFGDSPDLDRSQANDSSVGDDHGLEITSDYAVDAVDLLVLMSGAGPRGVHLVGHSYGGTVAMLAAAARPDLVRSLVMVEPCAHTVAAVGISFPLATCRGWPT